MSCGPACYELVRYMVIVRLQSADRLATALEIIRGASPSVAGRRHGLTPNIAREIISRMRKKAFINGCRVTREEVLAMIKEVDRAVGKIVGDSMFYINKIGSRVCKVCKASSYGNDPTWLWMHIRYRHADLIDSITKEVMDKVATV